MSADELLTVANEHLEIIIVKFTPAQCCSKLDETIALSYRAMHLLKSESALLAYL